MKDLLGIIVTATLIGLFIAKKYGSKFDIEKFIESKFDNHKTIRKHYNDKRKNISWTTKRDFTLLLQRDIKK